MGQTKQRSEQRTETRFPFHFPASLRPAQKRIKYLLGQMRNISMHGIMLNTPEPLDEYETVEIAFHVPQMPDAVITKGIVKWCRKKPDTYDLGIRFLESTSFPVPFHHVCLAYETAIQKSLRQIYHDNAAALENQISYLQHELYDGLFFTIFQRHIQKHLTQTIFDSDVLSFYLTNIAHEFEVEKARTPLQKYANESLQKAHALRSISENLIGLFRKRDFITSLVSSYTEERLDLDTILTECIAAFRHKLACIMLDRDQVFVYHAYDVPRLVGKAQEHSDCFDYLILFSYQSVLFQAAQKIKIDLNSTKDSVHVNFANDGSQMLHEKEVELAAHLPFHISKYHARDLKYLAFLRYAISFLGDTGARLLIQSESGHNTLKLRIPSQEI